MELTSLKSLWFFFSPGNLLFELTALVLILRLFRIRRWPVFLLIVVVAAEFALINFPVGDYMLAELERRYPPLETLPDDVAGIVVLGGAELTDATNFHGQPALNKSAERLTTFFSLMRRYPNARPIFAGGPSLGGSVEQADAVTARLLLTQLGADLGHITFDDRSHNTQEAMENSQMIAQPKEGEKWLIVTSAWNMPRVMGVADMLKWAMIPVPVDFRADLPLRAPQQLSVALESLELAAREWGALVGYQRLGRISSIFGPSH